MANSNRSKESLDSPKSLENSLGWGVIIDFFGIKFKFSEFLEIGISKKYIENTETPHYIIDEEIIRKIYKKRKDTSHKGNYGKTCIVAGGFGKIGAAVLATKSALYSGSGLTYILAPKCGYEILQTTCPEAMYLYGGEDFIKNFLVENDFTYGIGPGLGTDYETEESLMRQLINYHEPLGWDAHRIN